MKFDNLLRYALRIIEAYAGETPLHHRLKDFFRANPQMGSRDRKLAAEMVYCFYRLGHGLKDIAAEERIQAGLFLCNGTPVPALEYFRPEWHEAIARPVEDKIRMLQERFPGFSAAQIFPFPGLLSAGVDHVAYCLSFLQKPDLFIRARKGREDAVQAKLLEKQVPFHALGPGDRLLFRAYSFRNGTQLDGLLDLDREAVVQDLSSQRTAAWLKLPDLEPGRPVSAWDCCAGSGGKSILLADLYPALDLTVSDIRRSILQNLRARLARAGISRYRAFEGDLTRGEHIPGRQFDLIVADLPCTGSGTWSRTPEALYFFRPEQIAAYSARQQDILARVVRCLKPGGSLVYITCSVFAMENEQVTAWLGSRKGLSAPQQQLITGYAERADSLFAARFRLPAG
jgi:16S rRNA (cytosine967-C5)-methyltransferase